MPTLQEGQVFKLKTKGPDGKPLWAYRLRLGGRESRRVQKGGFRTKGDASEALRAELDRVGRIRRGELVDVERITFADLVDRYLTAHAARVRPSTIEKLRWVLSKAVAEWGKKTPDEIRSAAVEAWRAGVAEGHRFEATQALRQTLTWAVEHGFARTNVAKRVRNRAPRAKAVNPFESWADVEALAYEIGDHYGPAVIFAAATGLRPAEWIGLEWRNVDRENGVVYVEQAVVRGERTRTKTAASRRFVPLTDRALDALDAVERRDLSSRLVFTTKSGKADRPSRLPSPLLESGARSRGPRPSAPIRT